MYAFLKNELPIMIDRIERNKDVIYFCANKSWYKIETPQELLIMTFFEILMGVTPEQTVEPDHSILATIFDREQEMGDYQGECNQIIDVLRNSNIEGEDFYRSFYGQLNDIMTLLSVWKGEVPVDFFKKNWKSRLKMIIAIQQKLIEKEENRKLQEESTFPRIIIP